MLQRYFENSKVITPDLSTDSIRKEIILNDSRLDPIKAIQEIELACSFKTMAEQFQVIESQAVTAVADAELIKQIRLGRGDWRSIQKHAINIPQGKVRQYRLAEISKGVYQWSLPYDAFLGYMAGVISEEQSKTGFISL